MNDIMILLAPTSPTVRHAMIDANIAETAMDFLRKNPPSRCMDIQSYMGGPYKGPSIQKISAIMRKLCEAGVVQRVENPDEKTFVPTRGDGEFGRMIQIVRFTIT